MTVDMPADLSGDDERRDRKVTRHTAELDVAELERRVHLAELHAREAEAEVRYLEAAAKRKALKGARKDGIKAARKEQMGKRRRGRDDDED